MVEGFKKIRDNPIPKALFFTCMDSRMLPSRFTQTQVGDMFIVRSPGNLIPHSSKIEGGESFMSAEPAALELACKINSVQDVVVCGHSDCKAMINLFEVLKNNLPVSGPLRKWLLAHGYTSYDKFSKYSIPNRKLTFNVGSREFIAEIDASGDLGKVDQLSQVNCLEQINNICSYDFMKELVDEGKVRLHAMWFDIYTGNVLYFRPDKGSFEKITEDNYLDMLNSTINAGGLKGNKVHGL